MAGCGYGYIGGKDGRMRRWRKREDEKRIEEEGGTDREEGTVKSEKEIYRITLHFLLEIQICPCSSMEIGVVFVSKILCLFIISVRWIVVNIQRFNNWT